MKNERHETMKANYLQDQSLPKGEAWQLSNGWIAHLSYTWHGISFVSKLESPDGKKYWHCSNGLDFREGYAESPEVIEVFESLGAIPLPDFAKPFVGKVKDFRDRPIAGLVSVFFSRND